MPSEMTGAALYSAVRDALASALADIGIADNSVYVAVEPDLWSPASEMVVIVPRGASVMHPDNGLKLVQESFDVVAWKSFAGDQGTSNTQALTEATSGLLAICGAIRSELVGSDLDGSLVVSVTMRSGHEFGRNSSAKNWLSCTEHYRCEYEIP